MTKKSIWWAAMTIVVIFIGARLTHIIDVELYNEYNLIPILFGILTAVGIPILNEFNSKLTLAIMTKSKKLVLTVAIINFLGLLALLTLIYISVYNLIQVKEWYPGLDISNYISLVMIMITAFYFSIILECEIIKKLTKH